MHYSLCDLPFRVVCLPASREAAVARILENLFSPTRVRRPDSCPGIEIVIDGSTEPPVSGELVFDAPGLSAIRTKRGYYLRSRESFLAIDPCAGRAEGSLSDDFLISPLEEQRGLFLFALLLLLSGRGLYGLHAASISSDGCGFLLVGDSGSGKTTLTCALSRCGWQYLSDDSVLLTRGASGIEALALGTPFHCSPAAFRHFPELAIGMPAPFSGKRLVDPGPVYSGQFRSRCRPQVLLFPEIIDEPYSRLIPLDCTATLLRLVGAGAGLLNSREFMAAQMAVLGDLAKTARGFLLLHGADVHRDPHRLSALLQKEGDRIDAIHRAA
jgi:hypothetical protein